jgi:hypothetical protein
VEDKERGLQKVVLTHSSRAVAEIYLAGGHVTSWQVPSAAGLQEQLFVSGCRAIIARILTIFIAVIRLAPLLNMAEVLPSEVAYPYVFLSLVAQARAKSMALLETAGTGR